MTVYELIQELVTYPANTEVCVAVPQPISTPTGKPSQKFDIEQIDLGFRYPDTYPLQVILMLDMWVL